MIVITTAEIARLLGISVYAARKRMQRQGLPCKQEHIERVLAFIASERAKHGKG